jgi:hypothetical protein
MWQEYSWKALKQAKEELTRLSGHDDRCGLGLLGPRRDAGFQPGYQGLKVATR